MRDHHLAQLNVGRLVAAKDSPVVADFMDNLEAINAIAESAPGFIWRLQDASGNATGIAVTLDESFVINLSVWETIEDLHAYVYHSDHTPFVGRRREWFEPHTQAHMTMWWIEAGNILTIEEAMTRLGLMRENGPSVDAFTFQQTFTAPE